RIESGTSFTVSPGGELHTERYFHPDFRPVAIRSDAESRALIDDITAVTVGVPDPEATAALWAAILGLEPAGPALLDFGGCAIEFTAHPRGQLLAAAFRLAGHVTAADAAGLPGSLLGLRARYEAPAG
ncbi:MAG: hypothetical protein ACRDL8_07855, partial [Solirubrobacteraceae bacterium]